MALAVGAIHEVQAWQAIAPTPGARAGGVPPRSSPARHRLRVGHISSEAGKLALRFLVGVEPFSMFTSVGSLEGAKRLWLELAIRVGAGHRRRLVLVSEGSGRACRGGAER